MNDIYKSTNTRSRLTSLHAHLEACVFNRKSFLFINILIYTPKLEVIYGTIPICIVNSPIIQRELGTHTVLEIVTCAEIQTESFNKLHFEPRI